MKALEDFKEVTGLTALSIATLAYLTIVLHFQVPLSIRVPLSTLFFILTVREIAIWIRGSQVKRKKA